MDTAIRTRTVVVTTRSDGNNARLFIKETIRDKIISQLSGGESFNALHSSDHAAEAWHLIEVLAPDLMEEVRTYLHRIHGVDEAEAVPQYGQAA